MRETRTMPGRRRPRAVRALVGLAVGAVAMMGIATPASAAELTANVTNPRVTLGYDPEGTGTEVSQDTEITTSTTLTFHADWSIPGQSNDGDTFLVPVPSPFRIASSEPFTINGPNGPLTTCQYSVPDLAIRCTVIGGPHANAEGTIWFTGRLDPPGDPSESPTWEVGGTPVVLPTPHVPPPGPYTPPFGTTKRVTSASIVGGKAQLQWGLEMWPGCDGPVVGTCVDEFTVSDQLVSTNPAMPHSLREGSFVLYRWDRAQNPDGTWVEAGAGDTGVPGSHASLAWYDNGVWTVNTDALDGEVFTEPQVSADGKSYTFHLDNATVPHQYRLAYWSDADGVVSLDDELYQNTATVNGDPKESSARPRVQGGGGADAGAYTSFVASKRVTDESGAVLPEEYTLTATQGGQTETITVPADGTQVNSPYFLASGGPITICETVPSVAGVIWAPYTVTGTGVTGPDADGCYTLAPAGGERIEIVVDNRATPADGTFSVTKALDADERVTGLVGDTTFTIAYTVNGVAQTPLTVAAGETVTSPALPAGASVALTEVKPDVFGVVWGPEVFTRSSFTIDGGGDIAIELTNPATPATVSVGDHTWIDADRDGIQDEGEQPLAGVEVTLTGPDGTEVTDVTGAVVGPQVTDENGDYLFENLPPLQEGSYTVTVTGTPDGYYPTPVVEAGDDRAADSSDGSASSYLPLDVDGAADLTLDFGFVTYTPEIDIVKKDIDGNDANTEGDAADLTDRNGATTLEFVVTNTGDEPLIGIELVDVSSGSGTVDTSAVSCAFPDDTTGTTWAGPLLPGEQITCTAPLTDVTATALHRDTATVTAVGYVTGQEVSDDDPYHAKVTPTPAQQPTPKELGSTGVGSASLVLGAAALLLLGGFAAVAGARRRRESV